MKKGIVLLFVFAVWFIASNKNYRQLLFNKNTTIETKVQQLAMAAAGNLFYHTDAKTKKPIKLLPVHHFDQTHFCSEKGIESIPPPEKITNSSELVTYPLLPLFIHTL
jgi:hypothetical protein